jgi:hypothetical protein
MLPVSPLPESDVDVGGSSVHIRSLSRDEVVTLARYADDTSEAEVFILSRACDIPEDEARAWRTQVTAPVANVLLVAIGRLSGLASGEA